MKSSRVLKNQKGFSLVELMVVVAIIGILAVIGIPQYQKFMSKARQSEAKTHLNAIFQGESSFFTEYSGYTTNLRAIGAGAVGQALRYDAGFANGAPACSNYNPVLTAGGPANGTANENSLTDTLVNTSGATWYYVTAPPNTGLATVANADTACDATARTYTAAAWGNPTNILNGTNNNADVFQINHQRLMTHLRIGL